MSRLTGRQRVQGRRSPETLLLSKPGDADERAAEALAHQALRAPRAGVTLLPSSPAITPISPNGIHRAAAPGAAVASGPSASVSLPASGGSPLPQTVRATFEPRFGHDFSKVRVHADASAAAAAEALDARAFTLGSDVVFAAGQYAPHTSDGERLLAHELAHVVQTGGAGTTIHRWHDDGHTRTTEEAVDAVGADRFVNIFNPSGAPGPYDTGDKIRARLMDASVNMDRFVPSPLDATRESHSLGRLPSAVAFGGSALAMGIGRWIGNETGLRSGRSDSRGVIGEGPDHGEAGKYIRGPGVESENRAREDHYINLAVSALQSGNIDLALNKLGDACHVAADRGSHGEGIRGRGHDTPAPGPDESGTQLPYFMENLNDCDDLSLNTVGYAYGLARTTEMLNRFLARAAGGTSAGTETMGRFAPAFQRLADNLQPPSQTRST